MQGRNHLILAMAVPIATGVFIGPETMPPGPLPWGALALGSLLPDLDGGGSIAYMGNLLPRSITPAPLRAALNGLGRAVSDVIRATFGHRNALHWPVWGVLMFIAGRYLGLPWLMWLGIGYVLHILGDSLTIAGVPLFGPIIRKDISFFPMRTGGFLENVLSVGLWLFVAWGVYQLVDFIRLPEMGTLFTFITELSP